MVISYPPGRLLIAYHPHSSDLLQMLTARRHSLRQVAPHISWIRLLSNHIILSEYWISIKDVEISHYKVYNAADWRHQMQNATLQTPLQVARISHHTFSSCCRAVSSRRYRGGWVHTDCSWVDLLLSRSRYYGMSDHELGGKAWWPCESIRCDLRSSIWQSFRRGAVTVDHKYFVI
jgi:hypothetical protein